MHLSNCSSRPACVALAAVTLAFGSPASRAEARHRSASTQDPEPPARGGGMRRHAPLAGQLELGIYGGLMIPSRDHSFFGTQWRALRPAVGSVGARVAYYPLRWFGAELEAGGFPGRTAAGNYFNALALRGHAIFQVPYRLAPFILGGVGALAVRTPREVLGSDIDLAAHVGAGLKFRVLAQLSLRLEWRGSFTNDRFSTGRAPAVHNEVLFGVSCVFGGRGRER